MTSLAQLCWIYHSLPLRQWCIWYNPWSVLCMIWVRSRNCGCLVTLPGLEKPGNKTATVPCPDPYNISLSFQRRNFNYLHYLSVEKWWKINVYYKNIERHTAHTIVSWPSPKQWVIVHTSDLMMIIRQSIYILSINSREMGELNTHSPTYCIMDNWENMLNLTHTLDKIYLTDIL